MSDLWAVEIERVAERTGVASEALSGLVGGERGIVPPEPAPLDEAEIMRRLGRLLVSAAEELESIGEGPERAASSRGGLLGLAAVAGVLELPLLAEWAGRLAASEELESLAPDAGRMLRGEAFEMVWTQSLIELRECDWRWPERRVEAIVRAEPEPEPEIEAEPVPEPVPVPPAEEPASRGAAPRALIADPSAIAASFLARSLASRGIEVTVADSADRMSAHIAGGTFDAAFVSAEWPLPAGAESLFVVRLIAEGASHRAGIGERVLRKPPAEEEVDAILEAWSGRRSAHSG